MALQITEINDLESVLRPKLGDQFKIIDYSTTNLTSVGENYGSTMLSLTVIIQDTTSGSESTLHLVAKMSPAAQIIREVFQIDLTFPKECSIYTIVAPQLNKFQVERQVPHHLQLNVFCDCFGARDRVDDEPLLLLENLKMQGFTIGDRHKGFNRKHSEFILTNLAHFHAVPIALRYLNPQLFASTIRPSLEKISMANGMQPEVGKEIFEVLNSTISSLPELANIKDRIRNHLEFGWQRAGDLNYHRESAFNTICHNDFWVNNMMISYGKNDDLNGVKFVDYQFTYYGSGFQDLIFFLFTSVENETLLTDFDHLVQHYLVAFLECLKAHGCPMDDFGGESIEREIHECAIYEFHHVLLMTKVLLMDQKKLEKVSEHSDDFMTNSDLVAPAYFQKLKLVALEFEKRGWIIEDPAAKGN